MDSGHNINTDVLFLFTFTMNARFYPDDNGSIMLLQLPKSWEEKLR